MKKNLGSATLFVIIFSLFTGCSSMEEFDKNTPDGLFKIAQRYEKAERYEEALSSYSELKNKFPYSRFAVTSELKIADIHFERESFAEAKVAYELFKEFHPKHPKSDFVTYRIGLASYKQLPETIDRDLSASKEALTYFSILQKSYPGSQYIKDANEKAAEIEKKLIEKELYIADFYFKKEQYLSALGRYERLVQQNISFGFMPRALFGASISAFEIQEKNKGLSYYRKLVSSFPSSGEAKKIKSRIDSYEVQ